jgi:hypothetical protein
MSSSENTQHLISSLDRFESDESIFCIIKIRILDFNKLFILLKKLLELFSPLLQLIIEHIQLLLVDEFNSFNSFLSYQFAMCSCNIASFLKALLDFLIWVNLFNQVFRVIHKFNFLKDIFDFDQVVMPIIVVQRQLYIDNFCQWLATIFGCFTFQVLTNHFFKMHPKGSLECSLIFLLCHRLSLKCCSHQLCIGDVTCH